MRSVGDSVMRQQARQGERYTDRIARVPIPSCKNFIFYVK